jgi:hypothetical protein
MTTPMSSLRAAALAEARQDPPRRRAGPLALLVTAALGLAWNAFGVVQWAGSLRASSDTLMGSGLTAAQAAVYLGLPAWMTVAFAIGVFGGLIGSGLLAWRRRAAVATLATSLVAYVALYAGDMAHGLFDVMPSQQAILNAVVGIAVALLGAALVARRHGLLR